MMHPPKELAKSVVVDAYCIGVPSPFQALDVVEARDVRPCSNELIEFLLQMRRQFFETILLFFGRSIARLWSMVSDSAWNIASLSRQQVASAHSHELTEVKIGRKQASKPLLFCRRQRLDLFREVALLDVLGSHCDLGHMAGLLRP